MTDQARTYNPVPPQVDLTAMEHQILDLWSEQDTFAASLRQTEAGPRWTSFEGPPTADGMPGIHHIEARVFKDIFPRFKTMQGYHVERKAGWDCHGLPVELAVERELGIDGKPDIERYGVASFNERCRESVGRHVDAFARLTTRMGYWVDLDTAYWTMNPEYVESCWWALKQIHSRGLLVEDYRVAPYCPRCGTTLSDHELAQGYETVTDPSVYVRFPVTGGPLAGQADLLVWTTTPWTLVSNTAVAVHPDVTYVVASKDDQTLVVAEPLAEQVLGDGWRLGQTFLGSQMELWTYQRPFELVEMPAVVGGTNYIVTADYVTTEDGTGLVHQAPAFGEDDMIICRQYGLPMVNPIQADGTFEEGLGLVGGMFFKAADPVIMQDLQQRGLMWRVMHYEHAYPHCWRCHTVLLYYAQPSWYIRTTQIKPALHRENQATGWFPDHIKNGRYGDWLNNNVDWALSRKRYWGTPLPIWRCAQGHQTCVGSREELSELAGTDLSGLDPHRPYVDEISFACPNCQAPAHRVPEVVDAWFDSGAMPFAQWGHPYRPGSTEQLEQAYPADFICEAIDQTRGWFYSLMAVGTLVFDQSPYRNVLCLGHILAEDGRKMSKHLGNTVEPIPLLDEHGADAVRWFMAAGGSPWSARRVGRKTIQEFVRKVLLTYWNTVAFQALYARANDWAPSDDAPAPAQRQVLDRWLLSATHELIGEVTDALERFDTLAAGNALAAFTDQLSNWYVRRSRRRFWDGDPSALSTLHEVLEILTRLLAPLVPFITERVWQDLVVPVVPGAPASVHLASWPVADPTLIDPDLSRSMAAARRVVELGRAARSEAKVRTRQPLQRALVASSTLALLGDEIVAEVTSELNVGQLESFSSAGDLVDYAAKGNFRALGKRFGKQTPQVAQAIAAADAAALAQALRAEGRATVDGGIEVSADEVFITERPREGWSVVNEQGETVALDLDLTAELVQAGWLREVIRAVQEARKNAGLDVSDRIRLRWAGSGPAAEALRAGCAELAEEVLAVQVDEVTEIDDPAAPSDIGIAFEITKA